MWVFKTSRVLNRGNINFSSLTRSASIYPNVNKKPNRDVEVPKSWNAVVGDAEKVVGYTTSFLNLRWLLSDEFANIGLYIKKLLGTGHPILETARGLLVQSNVPSWGLIILLVSKAGGLNKQFPDVEKDISAGILHKQRVLAEVAEMLRMSNKIHRSLYHISDTTDFKEDMFYGNKIALLCGDYLLSHCYQEISNMRNSEVHEILSTSLRDLSESEFYGLRDSQNKPLPSERTHKLSEKLDFSENDELRPKEVLGNTIPEWRLRSMLSGGAILASFIQCALKLANHSQVMENNGYLMGKHIALTLKAFLEIEPFVKSDPKPFSLVSAPMLFHLDHDPNIYSEIEKGLENVNDVNYTYLYKEILKGPALQYSKQLKEYHAKEALRYINTLPESDSRLALTNIVTSMM